MMDSPSVQIGCKNKGIRQKKKKKKYKKNQTTTNHSKPNATNNKTKHERTRKRFALLSASQAQTLRTHKRTCLPSSWCVLNGLMVVQKSHM
jgi:hypothetical protein